MASVSPDPKQSGFATLKNLLPYLWPVGEWNLRARVVVAMVFLVLSKVAIVMVPIFYKDAVDALVSAEEGLLLIVPVGVILAYGLARIASLGFSEARDAIFARVGPARHPADHPGGLPPPASSVPALSSGAPDRRPLARDRTRHRAIELLLRISLFNLIPTTHRTGAGLRHPLVHAGFRHRRHHAGHGGGLHRLHHVGDGVAHPLPADA